MGSRWAVVALWAVMAAIGIVPTAQAECAVPAECPAEPSPPPPPTGPVDDPAGAATLLALANQERANAGLPALTPRLDVTEIAQAHSRAMAERNTIWHNDDYFSSGTKKRLGAKAVGENVAVNNSLADAHTRLMNSPGHRANIMDARFSVAGFAVTRNPDGRNFITEDFLQPLPEGAEPDPDPPAAAPRPPSPAPKPAPVHQPAPAAPVVVAPAAPVSPPSPDAAGEPLTLGRGEVTATHLDGAKRWRVRFGAGIGDVDADHHRDDPGTKVVATAIAVVLLATVAVVIAGMLRRRGGLLQRPRH